MEQIYTIPVNEAFDACRDDKSCGCAFCRLYKKLESDELSSMLGSAMMEPDIRIQTNKKGFCKSHYEKMVKMGNRLSLALILESHLAEVRKYTQSREVLVFAGAIGRKSGTTEIAELESSCYICERIGSDLRHMIETAVVLWERDEEFRRKFSEQPFFCLPHYRLMDEYAKSKLGKKTYREFSEQCLKVLNSYFDSLSNDVTHFCKKFDYRYENEPWGNSKDAIERSIKLLKGDF